MQAVHRERPLSLPYDPGFFSAQSLVSYLPVRHHQRRASPNCHHGNVLRYSASFKQQFTDIMPFVPLH
jgi:hypothetical protein